MIYSCQAVQCSHAFNFICLSVFVHTFTLQNRSRKWIPHLSSIYVVCARVFTLSAIRTLTLTNARIFIISFTTHEILFMRRWFGYIVIYFVPILASFGVCAGRATFINTRKKEKKKGLNKNTTRKPSNFVSPLKQDSERFSDAWSEWHRQRMNKCEQNVLYNYVVVDVLRVVLDCVFIYCVRAFTLRSHAAFLLQSKGSHCTAKSWPLYVKFGELVPDTKFSILFKIILYT